MDERIVLLGHGSGGGMSHDLVEGLFVRYFGNPLLLPLEDASVFGLPQGSIAFTTDSYVVKPLFFPGGDIGRLSVCGTVNDLSMRGAEALYLSAGFIIEEGFPLSHLERIVISMASAAKEAGVSIVCGDTKVVERGAADGLYLNTAGVGVVAQGVSVSIRHARPGDAVIVSGTVGDHGVTILAQRKSLHFRSPLKSDVAPLNSLARAVLDASKGVHTMRDPTRGGLATTLKEIAEGSSVGIDIAEEKIPVSEAARGACEMLGLDWLYLANEGKLVAVVAEADALSVLHAMRANALGKDAAIIGQVTADHPGLVTMRNPFGARRILEMLASDQFPRIC